MERKTWRSAGTTPMLLALAAITAIVILVLWFLWFYPGPKPVRTHPDQPTSHLAAPLSDRAT